MSIDTVYTEQISEGVSIVKVEVTDAEGKHISWEMHCDTCDEYDNGLTEAQAREDAAEHGKHGEHGG